MSSPCRFPSLPAVLLILACGGISSAQTISVRTLALRNGEMPEVFLKGPKDHHALKFSAIQPATAVRALQANPLPLYTSVPDAEGQQSFVVTRQVPVPPGAGEILLLGWTAGETTRYVAVKDDFGAARFNNWLLINTTGKPIAFKAGEQTQPIQIAPGASQTYRITVEANKGAEILAQAPINGQAKTFFSTYWPVHAGKRTVVLFIEDGNKIRVKRISDTLAAPAPQP